MSSFSAFWRPLSTISAESWYPRFKDITIIFSLPYAIFFLCTNTSREHCFSPQVLKTKLQIHTLPALVGQKTLFLSSRETNGWMVPRLGWGVFLHFLVLKMQLLPSRETHISRVPSFVWAHFLLFGDLCLLFLPNHDTHGSRIRVSSFSAVWRPEKAISADSLNKRFKGTYIRVSSFSAFGGMKMRFLPSRVTHCSRVLLLV